MIRRSSPFLWALVVCINGVDCSLTTDLDGLSIKYVKDAGAGPWGLDDGGNPEGSRPGDLSPEMPDAGVSSGAAPDVGLDSGEQDASASSADASTPEQPDIEEGIDSVEDLGSRDVAARDVAAMASDATGVSSPSSDGDAGRPDSAALDGGLDGGEALLCPASIPASTNLALGSPSDPTGCGYRQATLPAVYVAVDPETFAASGSCGACIRIETGASAMTALVVDLGARLNPVDLPTMLVSKPVLSQLLPDGVAFASTGVSWRFVPCPTSGGLRYTLQTGSNASYAAVLIENHVNRLSQVELKHGDTYTPLLRTNYNYWVAANGMGNGPFVLRVTDILSQSIEQRGIPLDPGVTFQGDLQFPSCPDLAGP